MPLFAASVGAGELLVGAIVSVSTLTGMILKPLFGLLSDRWGRKLWLLIGLALFTGIPFLYGLVETPQQLFVLRLVHGLATAIFGPVSLAYVAEMAVSGTAERLGWFGMARSAGYLIAPTAAAWLLTWLDATTVFTIIGLTSCLAFLPALMLSCPVDQGQQRRVPPIVDQARTAFRAALSCTALWLAGLLDMLVYLATYSIKAFLPLYALYVAGFDLLMVGLFFSVQEGAHLLIRPLGGRLGDRLGYLRIIPLGLLLIAPALGLLPLAGSGTQLLLISITIGAGMGLIFPSTVALVSDGISAQFLGAGMGFLGTMRNAGKVIGPVLTGLALGWLDYAVVFQLTGVVMTIVALAIYTTQSRRPFATLAQTRQP
ncbi:MAG: MFS transporter [Proteobacteria bacterium]|nr:MFS transporter [Pseudomonadota bacterium]HCF72328.1 MFS transporter [Gammaproteobacteria bacterium]